MPVLPDQPHFPDVEIAELCRHDVYTVVRRAGLRRFRVYVLVYTRDELCEKLSRLLPQDLCRRLDSLVLYLILLVNSAPRHLKICSMLKWLRARLRTSYLLELTPGSGEARELIQRLANTCAHPVIRLVDRVILIVP